MSDAYIDTSQTYDGDGTSSAGAASAGAVGAYNSIASFASAASTSGQTRGIVRRLNLGTSISISSTIDFTNDGTFATLLQLIGYPFTNSVSGAAISAVDPLSKTNGSYFNFATTNTSIGNSANHDHYWESAIITIHQSGTDNDGLTRKCIWSEWDATNSRMTMGLWPDLPAALTTSATFDISLATYDPGDISSITAWDSDTNARPILDGSGLGSSYVLNFSGDHYWGVINLYIKGGATAYILYGVDAFNNIVLKGYRALSYHGLDYTSQLESDDVYCDLTNGRSFYFGQNLTIKHAHVNSSGTEYLIRCRATQFLYSSFDKIKGSSRYLRAEMGDIKFKYCEITSTNNYNCPESATITLENCNRGGTLRELEKITSNYTLKIITSSDSTWWSTPPSGADFEIYVTTNNTTPPADDKYRAIFVHPAVVAASSETITVKVRPHGWTTDLTNADIWIEVDYFDESSGLHIKTATSEGTGTTYTDDTWSDLSVTFTPGQAGMVEVRCYLANYESGAYVLVDVDSGS